MEGHNPLRFIRSFLAMNFDDVKYYLQGTVWEEHQMSSFWLMASLLP